MRFAIAFGFQKTDGNTVAHSISQHIISGANSREEAIGHALKNAQEMKPGFAVWETLCLEIVDDEPTLKSET